MSRTCTTVCRNPTGYEMAQKTDSLISWLTFCVYKTNSVVFALLIVEVVLNTFNFFLLTVTNHCTLIILFHPFSEMFAFLVYIYRCSVFVYYGYFHVNAAK